MCIATRQHVPLISILNKSTQARKYSSHHHHHHHTDEVLFNHNGRVGVATLNRPKALNSLNLGMVESLTQQYKKWDTDPSVRVVLLKSNGKAFCAGGDVRAIYKAGKENLPLKTEFFDKEYQLNHLIHTLQRPHIALIDGITMGGGAGISVHGHFIVATENTVFAMPEVGIGFSPDVGGSYFLSRLPRGLGTYLAMTGKQLVGSDVKAAGIATHFIKSSNIPQLESTLAETVLQHSYADYDQALKLFEDANVVNQEGFESVIETQSELIERCFANKPSVANVVSALKKETSHFAKETLHTLNTVSPTAVHIAHELVKRGASMSFTDCLQMEYTVVQRSLAGHEFYEGVRAALIDKDRKPKWNPSSLEAVSHEKVLEHFTPIPGLPKIDFDLSRKSVRA